MVRVAPSRHYRLRKQWIKAILVVGCLVATIFVLSLTQFLEPQQQVPVGSVISPRSRRNVSRFGSLQKQQQQLYPLSIPIDDVWKGLLAEGSSATAAAGIVMEVGMHRAVQCVQAATAGYEAHCVEPSPKSFQRVQDGVSRSDMQDRIHLYNVAAGGSSVGSVPFAASGGTGDHVGEFDMWNMEARGAAAGERQAETIIQVPSMRLDDIIRKTGTASVYLLKIDTQGFEPTVFSGLTDSLERQIVQYILFEYWPRGMDLLANQPDQCIAAELLSLLASKGYTLYALGVQAHPKAPRGWKSIVDQRPLQDFTANCRWYFSVEHQFPDDAYKMGYWSDVLAVAPGAPLPALPVTSVGKALLAQILQEGSRVV